MEKIKIWQFKMPKNIAGTEFCPLNGSKSGLDQWN